MPLIKPPVPDPTLDPFDGGVGELSRAGAFAGNVATTLSWFWSPFSPLRKQWWVWYIIVWADGTRESSTEDYPPFLTVSEMKDGYLEVSSNQGDRAGMYDFRWLPAEEAAEALLRLGIDESDF
ncbi:hypothetical protein ACIQLJ_08460 [Microbacterium sp. NPDC091313]